MRFHKVTRPVAVVGTLAMAALVPTAVADEVVADETTSEDSVVSIDLLNITDLHGHITTSYEDDGSIKQPGAATIACEVEADRATEDNVIFTGSGDLVGASEYTSSILEDVPTLEALNAMGMAVSSTGNHEFDKGVDYLVSDTMAVADFPYLVANVTGNDALASEGDGGGVYTMDVDGVTVAFIGTVTDDLTGSVSPEAIAGLSVTNEITTTNAIAAELSDGDETNGEADVIVALTHAGAESGDNAFSDDVDVIFGGHTHVAYASTLTTETGHEIAVVQGDHYSYSMGHVALSYNPEDGTITFESVEAEDLTASTCLTDSDVASGEIVTAVQQIVADAQTEAATLGNQKIADIGGDLLRGANDGTDSGSNRSTESTASNFIADTFADWVSELQPAGADATYIGIMNPGGVRADYLYAASGEEAEDGILTSAEAYTVQPFGNEMGYTTLTGTQLKTLFAQQWQPGQSRQVLILGTSDNVEVVINQDAADELEALAAEWGSLESLTDEQQAQVDELRAEVIVAVKVDGVAVADDDEVTVASNSFLMAGGDHFDILGDVGYTNTGIMDRDTTASYLQALNDAGTAVTANYDKHQVGVSVTAGEEAGQATVDLTGLVFSNDSEKTSGAVSVRASVDGSEIATADIDTTNVASLPETGQATLEIAVPEGSASADCTTLDAEQCYTVTVESLDADGNALFSYDVEVEAPEAVTPPTDGDDDGDDTDDTGCDGNGHGHGHGNCDGNGNGNGHGHGNAYGHFRAFFAMLSRLFCGFFSGYHGFAVALYW